MQKIEIFTGFSFVHSALRGINICPYTKTGTHSMICKRKSCKAEKLIHIPQMQFIINNSAVYFFRKFSARNRMFKINIKTVDSQVV